MISDITDPVVMIDTVLHSSMKRYAELLSTPNSCPYDIADEQKFITGSVKRITIRLGQLMPHIAYDNGFWTALIKFVDTAEFTEKLRLIATNNGTTFDDVKGKFFQAVIETCGYIETLPPDARHRKKLQNLWGTLIRYHPDQTITVAVFNNVVARIMYRRMVRRTQVKNISIAN